MSSWRFFCIWNQTTPLALSQENIKKVSKHIDGFFAKNIEHISKHVDWFFAKNFEHIAKRGWMDLLPDLRIARSTTPAGGRQGQERSRKNRGGNNNQHLKVSKIENTSGDSKEIQNQSNDCWQLQSLPMGGAAGNWEGTKFEQEFTRSVQVGWTGCCNDQFLHVGLVCYDTTIHLICAVYISMTKYLAESMASLISFHFYMEVETEFIGLTIAFTSLCWNVSEWNAGWDCPQFRFQL